MDEFLPHLIAYEVQTAKVCPYRFLFDQRFIPGLINSDELKYSNIYFFCRIKKVRFDLAETKLLNKRTLQTTLIIGGHERRKVTASLYDLSHRIRSVHSTKEDYEDLVSDDDEFWNCRLDLSKSDPNNLILKQVANALNEEFEFIVTPEDYQFHLDLDLRNRPEVIYVGQSFRMIDRVQSHKTLHRAVSQLNDNDDLRLYFLTFRFFYGGPKDMFNFKGDVAKTMFSRHGKTPEFKAKIDLVERTLIHFLKPELNDLHVNTDIQEDAIIKELLLKNSVSYITIHYGMHGHGFQFWSQKQMLQTDYFSFDFNKPSIGYFDSNDGTE